MFAKAKYVENMVEPKKVANCKQAVMRKFCEALPADRLLQGNDCKLEEALVKEKSHRKYIDPESGATLTYASSLVVLAHFVGCLVSASRSCIAAISNTYSRTVTRISPTKLRIAFLSITRNSYAKLYYPKVRLFTVLLANLHLGKLLQDDRPPLKHVSSFVRAAIWIRI